MRRGVVVVACLASAAVGLAAGLGVAAARSREADVSAARARVLFRVKTTKRVVALTLDDGPDPRFTPTVLQLLEEYGAHATFFVVGENVDEHPDLVRAELAAGDQ